MRWLWLAFALVCGPALAATPSLPGFVPLPKGMVAPDPDNLVYETYGEAEFFPVPDADPKIVRGKHWHAAVRFEGVGDDVEGKTIWSERIAPAWGAAGWKVAAAYDRAPFSATLTQDRPSGTAFLTVAIYGAGDVRFDVVEPGPPPFMHVLKAPAPKPEKIEVGKGDFPYLPALPGSAFVSGDADSGPMEVRYQDSEQTEVVGNGSIVKYYKGPEGLSTLLFHTAWIDALTKGGWKIVSQSQGLHQSDAAIVAHYAAGGRDLWTSMHANFGEYSIRVADVGAKDMGSELDTQCHVRLDGVFFDFDKATLKAESEPALRRAADLLGASKAAKVEIQGHTDAVGSDDYNVTLSGNRARTVMEWLAGHGIAADRMTSKGYGKAVPIADNDTDAGRARNRRVEIARPDCRGK